MKCLECEKELTNLDGKRPKQFCNSTCRSKYWHKKKRELNIKSKKTTRKKDRKTELPPIDSETNISRSYKSFYC